MAVVGGRMWSTSAGSSPRTLCTVNSTEDGAADGREAACPLLVPASVLCSFVMPRCRLELATSVSLTDRRQLSRLVYSCCHD